MKRFLLAVSVFILSISFIGNSMGATSSGVINVYTEASVVCVIESISVDLGSYTGSTIIVDSSFDVQCTDTTPYTISYGEGNNFLAGERRLAEDLGYYLPYVLQCASSSGAEIDIECGNGTTIGLESSDTGTGLVQPFAVRVIVDGEQFIPSGTYNDSVVTTITY